MTKKRQSDSRPSSLTALAPPPPPSTGNSTDSHKVDLVRKTAHKNRTRPRATERDIQLTSREVEVLRLMATGLQNKEIGTALFITEGTVKIHVHNILSKLAVTSRTAAIARALTRALL